MTVCRALAQAGGNAPATGRRVRLRQASLAAAAALHIATLSVAADVQGHASDAFLPASPEAGDRRGSLERRDWDQIRRAVLDSAYHARPVASRGHGVPLYAPNRQQGYRTVFRRGGIQIAPTSPAASWRLGLSVVGYGYHGEVRPLERTEPLSRKDRVEYRRDALTEWYVNRPSGLEQGFEIRHPPPGRAEPLVIAMAVESDLHMSLGKDGVSFSGPAGQPLVQYAGLKAWDADRRSLPTRLEVGSREVRLVVEAQGARFPVSVDPVFVHEAQLFGHGDFAPPADAEFGSAVSVSGDTAVIGVPRDNAAGGLEAGSAYVFVRSGTTWTEQARLTAADGAALDWFGYSVSVSGDTAVIGAAGADTPAGADAGAAYVFVRTGTTWAQQQKMLASDGAPNDLLGFAVSVSGDTLVAGAPFHGLSAGSAYVFVRSGATWSQEQKLAASDPSPFDRFAFSVSVSGDTLVAGAISGDGPAGIDVGSAYVFVRAGTTWSQQQELNAADGAGSDRFGYAVSLSLDTAIVGAPLDDNAGGPDAGSAYVFLRVGTFWVDQQKLVASDTAAFDNLGISVSLSGDTAVLGASAADLPGALDAGSAYVFVRSGTTWTEQQKLAASDAAGFDLLGWSVSVSGDTVVAGARLDDTATVFDTGSAYVFVRSGTAWSEQQKLLASVSGAALDGFGGSVSLSGDTALIGAPGDDSVTGTDVGSAYVFVRSGSAWSEQQKLVPPGGTTGDFFGAAAAVSGDTAAIIGGGSAYLFVRSGATWTLQQELLPPAGSFFESSLSLAGDTLVIGAPGEGTGAGAAYVFVRSGTVWTQQQKLQAVDGAPGDSFGLSVALSGDTAAVGAPFDTNAGGIQAGSVYMFVRSGTVWSQQQKILASDGAATTGSASPCPSSPTRPSRERSSTTTAAVPTRARPTFSSVRERRGASNRSSCRLTVSPSTTSAERYPCLATSRSWGRTSTTLRQGRRRARPGPSSARARPGTRSSSCWLRTGRRATFSERRSLSSETRSPSARRPTTRRRTPRMPAPRTPSGCSLNPTWA
jgi:hypothetical protein